MFSLRNIVFAAAVAFVSGAHVDPLEAYGFPPEKALNRVDLVEGKLSKIVLKEGNGKKAKKGSTVTAHYDGKLAEGADQFDSSRKR